MRLSGSTAFRTPTFLEAYLTLPIQLSLPGVRAHLAVASAVDDPNFILQPEQVTTAEVSYLNQQSDYFEVELTAYYNRVTNLIELAPSTATRRSSTRRQASAASTRRPAGTPPAFGGWDNQCDVLQRLRRRARRPRLPGRRASTSSRTTRSTSRRISSPTGCDVPPTTSARAMHKVNAGVQVRTKIGFNGEITFYYQSPQVWNEQVATLAGIVYQQFPLPAYTLFNGQLGFRFYKDKAEVAATVFNALADVFGPRPPQEHPFGNRIGRRVHGLPLLPL